MDFDKKKELHSIINENHTKPEIDELLDNINRDFRCKHFTQNHSMRDILLSNIKIEDPNHYVDYRKRKKIHRPIFETNEKQIIQRILQGEWKEIKEMKEIKEWKERNETKVWKEIIIDNEVNTISDILQLIDTYKIEPTIKYNINMQLLHNIKDPLDELHNMIGMKELKNNLVDQLVYFAQELHKNKNTTGDFMHTVIYGPPGTGKTEIAKMMGKIYSKMGILTKGTFKKVTRSDLIAGYLGQTALKTREVIQEALGGVLFIDEAYSLGNPEKRDSFSKECIDTLCECLSDHKENLMVIIAGYEKELKECFFNYNQGLESRFTWRFQTDDYNHEDLYHIFVKKVKDIGWEMDEPSEITSEWFKKNMEHFKSFGRDIETLLAKTKISHSKRIFCRPEQEKKKIRIQDLNKGFEIYLKNESNKKKKEEEYLKKQLINTMYC